VAIIRLSKSPSWGLVVVCISVGRSIQKLSFKTFAEIPSSDWNRLMALLADDSSRNLYFFGHAGKSLIGKKSSNHLTGSDLQFILHSSSNPLATNGSSHVYRFVFLDGCQTAAGDLPVDFGIGKRIMPQEVWNKAGLAPRSFLGWKSYTGTTFRSDGTVIQDGTRMQ
jgi:hypothetical protein